MSNTMPSQFDPTDLTERFPLSTVFSSYMLWRKWVDDGREFTTTETGRLTGEMLRQIAMAWANTIAEVPERREIVSEFVADIYAMATLETDGYDRGKIKDAIDGEFEGG